MRRRAKGVLGNAYLAGLVGVGGRNRQWGLRLPAGTRRGKTMTLRIAATLAIAVAWAGVVGCSDAKSKPDAENLVEYLYVQMAHSITSEGNTLTLHGVAPTTLYFADRPDRIAGHGPTAEVVRTWGEGKNSFAADPPNAALSIAGDGDENMETLVVVLSDPKLEGDKLTYTVKVLEGTLPKEGKAAALFIDIIGRPLTPLSIAGVHRRHRRRAIRRHRHYHH